MNGHIKLYSQDFACKCLTYINKTNDFWLHIALIIKPNKTPNIIMDNYFVRNKHIVVSELKQEVKMF